MPKKLTQEDFITRAVKIYKSLYDYSEARYVNAKTKVKIRCLECGTVFMTTPDNHLRGHSCPFCHSGSQRTTAQFVQKAQKIHGARYSYSKSEYKSAKEKLCIICPIHGEFWQLAFDHLHGAGCPICGKEKSDRAKALSKEAFIRKAREAHGNKYDYSSSEYKNSGIKICIICPVHGNFWQRPYAHAGGQGCPLCAEKSKGEEKISALLKEAGLEFIPNCAFAGLEDKRPLQYDFYLPEENLLIEYNGVQHYKAISFFGGKKQFHLQKHHDWLKRKYARDHSIELLVIPYWQKDHIKDLLQKSLRS